MSATFIKNLPKTIFLTHEEPIKKSVRDRFVRLEKKRRTVVRENERLFGNVETLTNLDMLFEDLILENDDFE